MSNDIIRIERKAASTFFATPPEAKFADAIKDFAAVDKLKPEWLDNLLFLSKSLMANGDKDAAVKYLKRAAEIDETDEDGEETDASKEAKELLKKYQKLSVLWTKDDIIKKKNDDHINIII